METSSENQEKQYKSKRVYYYMAYCERVIDGDTIVVNIDLGFNTWLNGVKVRLLGIDAAELHQEKGKAAKALVQQLIEKQQIVIRSQKIEKSITDSFGRYLVKVWYIKYGKAWDLNKILLKQDLALVYQESS